MHISHVKISNVLGIEELSFDAGRWNEITAANGSGKTSVLEAIKSVVRGGEDATLLRNGADKGEIVLVLDDGHEIKQRLTERGVYTTMEREGVRLDKPATRIKALADMLSLNPVDFLRARAKDRVKVLLESLPLTVDPERIRQIVGHDVQIIGEHAYEQLGTVYNAVFNDRTGTNRALKEKEATINQLAATLPAGEVGAAEDPAGLESEIGAIDAERDEKLAVVDAKLSGYRQESQGREDAIRAQITELEGKIAAERQWMADTVSKAGLKKLAITRESDDGRRPLAERLAAIRASADTIARAAQTRETIKTLRTEADNLRSDSERQTEALNGLEAYRHELLSALPIQGLEVRDGEVYRNGVTFDRLNKAQQVEIAVEIAKLRAGTLGVICVDELESLDTGHLAAFREQALASGLQLFVTRVSDAGLAVTTA